MYISLSPSISPSLPPSLALLSSLSLVPAVSPETSRRGRERERERGREREGKRETESHCLARLTERQCRVDVSSCRLFRVFFLRAGVRACRAYAFSVAGLAGAGATSPARHRANETQIRAVSRSRCNSGVSSPSSPLSLHPTNRRRRRVEREARVSRAFACVVRVLDSSAQETSGDAGLRSRRAPSPSSSSPSTLSPHSAVVDTPPTETFAATPAPPRSLSLSRSDVSERERWSACNTARGRERE